MYIIIRHADDSVIDLSQNDNKHDTTITNSGKRKSYKLAKKLVKKYGIPDVIYCSPFQRGRNTVKEMMKVFTKEQLKHIKILVDINLTKYFTDTQKYNPKIHHTTSYYNIPVVESKEDVLERSHNHLNRLYKHHSQKEVIWSITHAIVVNYIGQMVGKDKNNSIDFLEYITIH